MDKTQEIMEKVRRIELQARIAVVLGSLVRTPQQETSLCGIRRQGVIAHNLLERPAHSGNLPLFLVGLGLHHQAIGLGVRILHLSNGRGPVKRLTHRQQQSRCRAKG